MRLVQSVCNGSLAAWHEFVNQYSGLLYTVVRRHLPGEDFDDHRTVYVDLLEALYNGALAKYEGRARLSTWLIVFARRRALDFFRSRHGRYREPQGIERLSDMERAVLKYFCEQKLPLEIVIHMMHWEGFDVGAQDIADAVQRIDAELDRRYLRRLDQQHTAHINGEAKVRVLRALMEIQLTEERRRAASLADAGLIEEEAGHTVARLREQLALLSPEERTILRYRFDKGLTASDIARKMRLSGQRRVYTIIDRALRKLREAMLG